MSEVATDNADPRYVVVSKRSESDKDYVSAAVHPTKESAEEGATELGISKPWFVHTVVPVNDHLNADANAGADETGEEK